MPKSRAIVSRIFAMALPVCSFIATFLLITYSLANQIEVKCHSPFNNSNWKTDSNSLLLSQMRNSLNFAIRNDFFSIKFARFKKELDNLQSETSGDDFIWRLSILTEQVENYHTFLVFPQNIGEFGFRIQAEKGQYFITRIDDELLRERLQIGDRLVKINDETCFFSRLVFQPVGSTGRFEFQNKYGELHSISLTARSPTRKNFSYKILSRVVYFSLPSFSDDSLINDFNQSIHKIDFAQIQGIILDLRGNSGGKRPILLQILSAFFSKRVGTFRGGFANNSILTTENIGSLKIPSEIKMAVVVDRETFSAAELATFALKKHRNAKIVGTPTKGGLESSVTVSLTKNVVFSIATSEFCDTDGQCMFGKKLLPDTYIENPSESFLINFVKK
jgi:C-terminal processing protease CtpA/Prc